MAKKRDNKSFYGMRVVSHDELFVGVCCEVTDTGRIALRFYHNDYGKYVYDHLATFPRRKICTGETVNEALYNLRKIVNEVKPSYKVYLDVDCYNSIVNYYKFKSKVS